MPFLALLGNPLIRYAAAGLGMLLALWGAYSWAYGRGESAADARHAVEMQRFRDATVKLAEDRRTEIAARERANEELNTRLSKEVSDARQETDTAHGLYNDAVRMLVKARSVNPNCTPRGSEATNSSGNQELETRGIFISEGAAVYLGDRAAASQNTESVMAICQKWAFENGR